MNGEENKKLDNIHEDIIRIKKDVNSIRERMDRHNQRLADVEDQTTRNTRYIYMAVGAVGVLSLAIQLFSM